MIQLINKASKTGYRYNIYNIRKDGSFKVNENIEAKHTTLRILEHKIGLRDNKILALSEIQETLDEVNKIRKENGFSGIFELIKDISKKQEVYRVQFSI